MKNLTTLLTALAMITSTIAMGQIINVPGDQPTIQAGIDVASEGDTVLVQPGTYLENINFNGKNITVASLFLTTQDSAYILQTIIDGDSLSSVVVFESGEDSTTVFDGFTVQNGIGFEILGPWIWGRYGGGIYISESSPAIKNSYICENSATYGGGIFCSYQSAPDLFNVTISGNIAGESGGGIHSFSELNSALVNVTLTGNLARNGGGLFCCGYNHLSNVLITGNFAKNGGGIYFDTPFTVFDTLNRCQIYNNYALTGNDLYTTSGVEIAVDTFSVLFPSSYHAVPVDSFSMNILNGKITQVDADLYVSIDGDNTNSGISADEPLKNIRYAFSKILAGDNNPHTIHLADGTYGFTTTGEVYPLNIPDNVSLVGESEEGTILDGEDSLALIRLVGNTGTKISTLTITNGMGGWESTGPSTAPYHWAGGITCHKNSDPFIEQVTVSGNSSGIYCTSSSSPTINYVTIEGNLGIGLYCKWSCDANVYNTLISNNAESGINCSSSDPVLQNITITGNSNSGLRCYNSSPLMKNMIITYNSAPKGGGMYLYNSCYPSLENVTIAHNYASTSGGGINCEYAAKPVFSTDNRCNIYLNEAPIGMDYYAVVSQDVVVDTFTMLNPSSYYTFPVSKYTFSILNAKTTLVDDDIYVSPEGENTNSGLTPEEPLRNIEVAFSRIMADAIHQNTIYLCEGTYSPSSNGESIPVNMLDYTNLTGVSEADVILDAEGQSTVLMISNNISNHISNLTLTNGGGNNSYPSLYAGGITIYNSSVFLSDITVHNNESGGISCLYISSPVFENISIINNGQVYSGGGLYITGNGCNPILKNVLISGNQANNEGGGIWCSSHANPTFRNVTIANNTAYSGGGIYSESFQDPEITNSIVWNNSPNAIVGSFNITYSNIEGGWEGEGNIDSDPLFSGSGEFPYALTNDSPCINTGTPDTTGLNLPELDLGGNPRVYGGRIDMGTYENQNIILSSQAGGKQFEQLVLFPNPCSDQVHLRISNSEQGRMICEVFTISGIKMNELMNNEIPAGTYEMEIDVSDLPPGIYYCAIIFNNTRKMTKFIKL